jgi:large subunit ribosomal protein L23
MQLERVVRRPLVLTEKGNRLRETENQYLFEVARDANKIQIREAVETLFNVSVLEVRTMIVRGRLRRMGRGHAKTQNWKKAIVTLKEGDAIDTTGGDTTGGAGGEG